MLKVEEGKTNYGVRLISTEAIRRGQAFFTMQNYREVKVPTYQTIQVGTNRHIEELGVIAHLNHSCQPNVLVHIGRLACYAIRDINAGEELNFFYPSTEWDMARPFDCQCGAAECVRRMAGARHLSTQVLSRYFINEHIRAMVQEDLASTERLFSGLQNPSAG